jgi:large subunit ribosomal protein L6
MSRVAKVPVRLPKGVEVDLKGQGLAVKGSKGSMQLDVHPSVEVREEDGALYFQARSGGKSARAIAGTMRALASNMVTGVSQGFEKKLRLVGVGYRVQAQGRQVNLTLGFSHPVVYQVPAGVNVETPTQTELVVTGVDLQQVGQVAAEIRAFRPPEPYKGKGVRYVDERIVMKEAKKK